MFIFLLSEKRTKKKTEGEKGVAYPPFPLGTPLTPQTLIVRYYNSVAI